MIVRILKTFLAFILVVGGIHEVNAQGFVVKGRVLDSETREALAFVNILVNDGPAGGSTDIDGKYRIASVSPASKLRLSYIGYEPQLVTVNPALKEQLILLKKQLVELAEVVIKPGINPANRIIRKVLENRPLNDHERMGSFSYTTYEKTTFGPENDSIPFSDKMMADTSYQKMKKFFDRQHLFLMESITERQFMFPDKNYNKVVASRVSGFGDPLFVFLMSQLQSTSFYKEIITIADKQYINPISNGTLSKYYFEIYDTLIEPFPYDTTYIISYRPLLNTNFDGLKGTLSISTNNFAIRNVIAEPARNTGMMTIKIQQLYDFVQNEHWFPLQLNTDIIFKAAIGAGSISVSYSFGDSATTNTKNKKDLVGRGKSYVSDIRLNPELKKNQFGYVEVDVQPDAYRKPEKVWNQFRVDSLTKRDQRTYEVLDSLGKANHFDQMGYKFDAVINGKVPLGPVDLELDRILRINGHEGLRLGIGLHTNDKVSSLFQIGGFGAYGFRDKKWKYGGNAGIIIDRFHETRLNVLMDDDVNEAGVRDPFTESHNVLNPELYRLFLVKRMDHSTRQQVSMGSRMFNYTRAEVSLTRSYTLPLYDYRYITTRNEGLLVSSSEFYTTEASLIVRYAYGEKFLKNTRSLISLGTSYPIVWFGLGHGFKGLAEGQYEYNRFDFKMQKTLSFKYFGKTSIVVKAGLIDRDLPYSNLYNGLSDFQPFSFYSPNSFETMRMTEFAADRYIALFVSHNFGKLLYRSKHFNPEPVVLTNIGFGSLSHPENHTGIDVNSYKKGFFESGLLINNLLNMGVTRLGVGSFYRYGPYSFPSWKDDISFKLSVSYIF